MAVPPDVQQVKLRVATVALDPRDGRAVVLLVHEASARVFPLWVGDDEAAAIAHALSGRAAATPDGASLLAAVIQTLGAHVDHVQITGITERVVNAAVALADAEGVVVLPARVSDAVALALRLQSPILVPDELLSQVAARVADAEARTGARTSGAEPVQLSQAERWNQLLAHLSTSRAPKSYEG